MQVFVVISNDADDECQCECKELIDKGYIWNTSNCECECDKSCDVGDLVDYENCKCRKRLVGKLVKECNKVVEEVKILDKIEGKCSSCILDIVLFSIFFTINVGIATYFAYYRYMNHNKYDYTYHAKNY